LSQGFNGIWISLAVLMAVSHLTGAGATFLTHQMARDSQCKLPNELMCSNRWGKKKSARNRKKRHQKKKTHTEPKKGLGESGVLSRPSASATLCRTSWPPYAGCRIGGVSAKGPARCMMLPAPPPPPAHDEHGR